MFETNDSLAWYILQVAVNLHTMAKYIFFATIFFILIQPRFPIKFRSTRKRTAYSIFLVALCFGSIFVYLIMPSEKESLEKFKQFQYTKVLVNDKDDMDDILISSDKKEKNEIEKKEFENVIKDAQALVDKTAVDTFGKPPAPQEGLKPITLPSERNANDRLPQGIYPDETENIAYATASGVVIEVTRNGNCPCYPEDGPRLQQDPLFGKTNEDKYKEPIEEEASAPLIETDPMFGKDNSDSPLLKENQQENPRKVKKR